jgi:5-methylcytosine-specific restriction endonuclease McrA
MALLFLCVLHFAGAAVLLLHRPRVALMKRRGGSRVQTSFAHDFYQSWPWIKCARGYKQEKAGLCERCLAKGLIVPGEEVHHKIRLTPENINDPAIALSWDNLELLCKNCHLEEHKAPRWRADHLGHVEL